MKKNCFLIFLFLFPFHANGQIADSSHVSSEVFEENISNLEKKVTDLTDSLDIVFDENRELRDLINSGQQSIDSLQALLSNATNKIDSLGDEITLLGNSLRNQLRNQNSLISQSGDRIDSLSRTTSSKFENATRELDSTRSELSGLESETENRLSVITASLSKSIWWVTFGILFVLAVSFVGIWKLKGRFSKEQKKLDKKNKNLASKLAQIEQTNKADAKLLEILNEKLSEMPAANKEEDIDHSLALASALEITRMRKRIDRLEADSKGLKSLEKALERLEDELNIKGYEIIDLEGKKYHEGMNLKADFMPDEELGKGEEIITRTIKPQVNYRGKAIQHAHVQVSTGS